MKTRLKSITFKQIYITGIGVLFLGFILGLNNFNTDTYEDNLIQGINEINASVANLPKFLPATRQQISNAEAFSYSIFQASQSIGENKIESIPLILRFVPFSAHYNLQNEIKTANDVLSGPRESLLRASEDTEYLLKFIFYAPTEEFASYGQNPELDDERIQRTKQGFLAIINNPSLSEMYREKLQLAYAALEQFEANKDLNAYINSIAKIQSEIADLFNAMVANEQSVISDLYYSLLYQ